MTGVMPASPHDISAVCDGIAAPDAKGAPPMTDAVTRNTPAERRQAALNAAAWALRQDDPSQALRELLTVLGLIPHDATRVCVRCQRLLPVAEFTLHTRAGRGKVCAECRPRSAL